MNKSNDLSTFKATPDNCWIASPNPTLPAANEFLPNSFIFREVLETSRDSIELNQLQEKYHFNGQWSIDGQDVQRVQLRQQVKKTDNSRHLLLYLQLSFDKWRHPKSRLQTTGNVFEV